MTTIKMPLGIGTPEDQLEITTATVRDYLSSIKLHVYKAQIAAQQMHLLQDWTIQHCLGDFKCKNGNDFRNKIYAAEPRLYVVRDFANATKHGAFLKAKNPVLEKVERAGAFSREFSRGFDRVRLEMHVIPGTALDVGSPLLKGTYLELDDVLKSCLEFWTALYDTRQMPRIGFDKNVVNPDGGTGNSSIGLPEELDGTAHQLAIAQTMTAQSSEQNTPAAAYLAATSIAPLTNWAFADLRIPMEFPRKRNFREFLRDDCPAIGVTRELARAAKSGARAVGNAGRMAIVLKDKTSFDAAETFGDAIEFWKTTLAKHAGFNW